MVFNGRHQMNEQIQLFEQKREILELQDQLGYIVPAIKNTMNEAKLKDKPYFPFGSDEEEYFSWYLYDLKLRGFIKSWKHDAESFLLSDVINYNSAQYMKTKNKAVTRRLMDGHYYTPDFRVIWNKKAENIFYKNLDDPYNDVKNKPPFKAQYRNIGGNFEIVSTIEVKPKSHDYQNMERLVKLNIKWVYQNFGIYVQIAYPSGSAKDKTFLFKDTFTPSKYYKTRGGAARKRIFTFRTVDEYLNIVI